MIRSLRKCDKLNRSRSGLETMKKTLAEQFTSDPRIVESKRLLLEALQDFQGNVQGICPPDPDLKLDYEDAIHQLSGLRGAQLFYPYLGSGFGRGPLVELSDGSIKYDFISGIGVHHFGHSHPKLVESTFMAALSDTIMQGNLQQNSKTLDVCRLLLDCANRQGADLSHCFLSTSGAMANENALKLIFQRNYPKDRIIAFDHCFAGRTLALSQVTDKPTYREGLPSSFHVDYLPFYDASEPEKSIESSVAHLRRLLDRYPNRHAVMIFELVLGEGGFYPGTAEFFVPLMELCRQNEITIMVDEIQTFGRTTEPFAFQCFGLDKYVDVVTVGKAIQICATMFKKDLNPRPGLLSQTFTSCTSALFASEVILKGLMEGDFFGPDGKIAKFSAHFVRNLQDIGLRNSPAISGPFGFGAMIAFTPFLGDPPTVKQFLLDLFEAGVIAFYAGSDLSRVRFLIPIAAIDIEDIDAVCEVLEHTIAHSKSIV
jgi:4-aminobutyrate aminotransferase-like enzyme